MLVTLIAFVGWNITEPIISANRSEKIDNNIALLYSPEEGFQKNENQTNNAYRQNDYKVISDIYEVLDEEGNLHVLIYDVKAQGRNGDVSALVAVNPYTDLVEAVTYYEHTETPNIGEKYTREENISKLLGQNVSVDVQIDVIADASTTWIAIEEMFNTIETHYREQGVHLDE
jgi:Na+-transporting NADH:ubiquinone oxidoreductase subunit C